MVRGNLKMIRLLPMLIGISALVACSPAADTTRRDGAGQHASAQTTDAVSNRLVVVELFQSQGCSSCPPANTNVNLIAGRDDILALSFAVTYWDRLGWKDTFAKPEFTDRQRAYASRINGFEVATPQVVVNGRKALIGHRKDELDHVIGTVASLGSKPEIVRSGDRILIGEAPSDQPLRVLLVIFDPRPVEVPISAGENNGRTLPHRNIVRDLRDLGELNGRSLELVLPEMHNSEYQAAILLQQGEGGPLLAARKI